MFKGVIFDMDGTVVDSERLYFQIASGILSEHGYSLSREVFIATCGVSREEGGKIYSQSFPPLDGERDVMDVLDARYAQALMEGRLKRKAGCLSLLDRLKDRGIPTAVASSNTPEAVERTLSAAGLAGRFDAVIHAGLVRRVKPYPDLLYRAAEEIGVLPEECLVLEDSEPGILAAKAAGMAVILIPDMYPVTETMARLSLRVVSTLEEVEKFL